jgi:nicotinate-nucleotide adenylyltransferase
MSLFPPPHLLNSPHWRDLRVGLLGGSFNPPHEGHVHISLIAKAMLKLDCVWWLVSPQNPIKSSHETAPFQERMAWCEQLTAQHPSIIVTDIEATLGTTRSFDTLSRLLPRFPSTGFVWLTGLDNALSFHRWHRWRDITNLAATAHIARPPAMDAVRRSPLSGLKSQNHTIVRGAAHYSLGPKNTYWILENPMNSAASTIIRAKGSINNPFASGA